MLRLGAVYGEHDYQYRFEPVLRRLRAGRTRMPVGTGSFLFSRVYVGDVAQAVLAVLATDQSAAANCFNIVERQAAPMPLFYEQISAMADADLELVRVRDEMLPRRPSCRRGRRGRRAASAGQRVEGPRRPASARLRSGDPAALDEVAPSTSAVGLEQRLLHRRCRPETSAWCGMSKAPGITGRVCHATWPVQVSGSVRSMVGVMWVSAGWVGAI